MFAVSSFYKFVRLSPERVEEIRGVVADTAAAHRIMGLILLGIEGCNATISAMPQEVCEFKSMLAGILEFEGMVFKDSSAGKIPFRRFKIDIRREIVTLDKPELFPEATRNKHLSPREWHEVLASGEDVLLLDTRNNYETTIGKFKNCVDPDITKFNEFPAYVERAALPRDKKILMYCTGGIRCEKAILEMQRQGYNQVYQLDGGILNYLEQYPDGYFEGECFVFDHRVAVDKHLAPTTQYKLCPHCGNSATERLACTNCGRNTIVCAGCLENLARKSCSKNCAYHLRRNAGSAAVADES